ncbi:MAG: PAS domain-containing protein [Desulfobulbaceae bacterium]|nr:PAS domain-containing protein [Desulfobulbaceae bacterium]
MSNRTVHKKTLQKANIVAALDSVPHGIAFINSNLQVLNINRFLEALTGYTSAEALGINVDCILRTSLQKKINPLQQVIQNKESVVIVGDIINRARKKIPVRFTLAPMLDYSKSPLGVIMILEDLSCLQTSKKKKGADDVFNDIIGQSPKMQEIFELLPVVAMTEASLLLTGETGTGKDLLASTIHLASKRSRYPFIKVNCGAFQESLLKSELFGHKKGAYTGAVSDTPGMFGLANGGTIYLTEIGDLPLPLQVKLLTVLDDKEFYPLGSAKKVKADVRIIAATHHDLRKLVTLGKFREDLFYRLNILQLHLPPLREREGDLRLLIDHFLHIFSDPNKQVAAHFNPKTLDLLSNYSYPGNIRELRNIVEYGTTISRGETIQPEHLPRYLFSPAEADKPAGPPATPSLVQENPVQQEQTVNAGVHSWRDAEKQLIIDTLIATKGKRTLTAKRLGWGRTTLWRKIRRYGLE